MHPATITGGHNCTLQRSLVGINAQRSLVGITVPCIDQALDCEYFNHQLAGGEAGRGLAFQAGEELAPPGYWSQDCEGGIVAIDDEQVLNALQSCIVPKKGWYQNGVDWQERSPFLTLSSSDSWRPNPSTKPAPLLLTLTPCS